MLHHKPFLGDAKEALPEHEAHEETDGMESSHHVDQVRLKDLLVHIQVGYGELMRGLGMS
jgi:hypothetical protein